MTDGGGERPGWCSARCSASWTRPRSRSGSRPTGPARRRSSAARRGPSRSSGHHYALVVIDGLAPGTQTEYQVTLDGALCWPEPDPGSRPACCGPWTPAGRCGSRSAPAGSPSCPSGRAAAGPAPSRGRAGPRRRGRERESTARTRWLPSPGSRGIPAALARPPADDRRPGLRRRPGPATRQFIADRRDPSDRRATRSPVSPSTAPCTGRPGPSPGYAGCCRSSRRR